MRRFTNSAALLLVLVLSSIPAFAPAQRFHGRLRVGYSRPGFHVAIAFGDPYLGAYCSPYAYRPYAYAPVYYRRYRPIHRHHLAYRPVRFHHRRRW